MSSAIEVLKDFHDNIDEHLLKFNDGVLGFKSETEFAFREALLALEINNNLVNDLLNLANRKADDTITGNELISCLLKNGIEIEQKEGFIWKKKELQGKLNL